MTKVNIRSGPRPPKFRPAGPSPASRTAARPASNTSARIGRTCVREPAPISNGHNRRAVIDHPLKTCTIGEAVDAISNSSQLLPLTAAQTGMWFAQKFSSPDSIFNLAESIEIHGPIDPALFELALRQAGIEAETVRVRFIELSDGPRQMVSPTLDTTFPFIDVSPEPDPRAAAESWMMAELVRPVDLLTGPLWVCALFKAAPEHYFWYHRSHHIVMDGFTGGLFARRVAEIYTALAEGRSLEEGTFGPLALLLEEETAYRGSQRFARDRQYWLTHFADRPVAFSLADQRRQNVGGLLRQP